MVTTKHNKVWAEIMLSEYLENPCELNRVLLNKAINKVTQSKSEQRRPAFLDQ